LGIAPPAYWITFDSLFYQIFEDLSRMRATPVGTVDMTVEGSLARAVELLLTAQKTRKEERKLLCEKVMMYQCPLAQS
jgi:hypothetical protein